MYSPGLSIIAKKKVELYEQGEKGKEEDLANEKKERERRGPQVHFPFLSSLSVSFLFDRK